MITDQSVLGRAIQALRSRFPDLTAHAAADMIEEMTPDEVRELAAAAHEPVVFVEGANCNGRVVHGAPPEGFKLEPADRGRTVMRLDGTATNLEIRHGRNRPEEPIRRRVERVSLTEDDLEPLFLARPAFPAAERTVCPVCLEERHRTPLGGQVCLNPDCDRCEEVVK